MVEWEKKNEINLWAKKKKSKRKRKNKTSRDAENKENLDPTEKQDKESNKDREKRIQGIAKDKVGRWIEEGVKESWLSYKNI